MGHFRSPFANLLPDIMPPEVQTARLVIGLPDSRNRVRGVRDPGKKLWWGWSWIVMGCFRSPFAYLLPDIITPEVQTAR